MKKLIEKVYSVHPELNRCVMISDKGMRSFNRLISADTSRGIVKMRTTGEFDIKYKYSIPELFDKVAYAPPIDSDADRPKDYKVTMQIIDCLTDDPAFNFEALKKARFINKKTGNCFMVDTDRIYKFYSKPYDDDDNEAEFEQYSTSIIIELNNDENCGIQFLFLSIDEFEELYCRNIIKQCKDIPDEIKYLTYEFESIGAVLEAKKKMNSEMEKLIKSVKILNPELENCELLLSDKNELYFIDRVNRCSNTIQVKNIESKSYNQIDIPKIMSTSMMAYDLELSGQSSSVKISADLRCEPLVNGDVFDVTMLKYLRLIDTDTEEIYKASRINKESFVSAESVDGIYSTYTTFFCIGTNTIEGAMLITVECFKHLIENKTITQVSGLMEEVTYSFYNVEVLVDKILEFYHSKNDESLIKLHS